MQRSISLEKDLPYRDAANGTMLWRYLTRCKIEGILVTRQLWFSRVDTFKDQLEGRKPDGATDSPGEKAFFENYNVIGWGEQYPGSMEQQRGCYFACCWHMNGRESPRMWKEYTENCPDSVAIVGSLKKIGRGLKNPGRPLRFSPVKYVLPDDPHPRFDHESIFFYKDKEKYFYEQEYRILTPLMDEELPFPLDGDESKRRLVPFNFNVGITRIVFHPDASNSFKKEMRNRFRPVFGGVRQIEHSIL